MSNSKQLRKADKMFYRLSLLLVVLVCDSMANDEIIDPEELAMMSIPRSQVESNYTLDNCQEWDTWEAPEQVRGIWNYYRSGYDNDGNVVYISEFGKVDYRKLAEQSDEVIEGFWKYYEQVLLRIEYDAHNLTELDGDGVVMLQDFEGFTLAHYASAHALKFSLKMLLPLAHVHTAIKYGFFVNVNFAGESFIQLAKPFLGDSLNKVEISGSRSDQWKPRLLAKIPAIQLPPNYGGADSWKPLPIHVCKE